MKNFVAYIVSVLVLTFILLEIVVRVFNLAAHTLPTANINGNYLLQPGVDSVWVRGGLGEISSHYSINSDGWNSIVEYDEITDSTISVALIGDSYIQGMQSDVEQSIGRQLEREMNDMVIVHEYGRAGGNIEDYSLLYESVIKEKYDYIFVLLTDKDIAMNEPSFMSMGNRVPDPDLVRQIYNHVSTLRYFNINHGLGVKIGGLLNKGPESIQRIHNSNSSESKQNININYNAISRIDTSVIFLYEENKLSEKFISRSKHPVIKIKHKYLPKDHGFDGHWNINGRKNCALAMKEFIESYQEINK